MEWWLTRHEYFACTLCSTHYCFSYFWFSHCCNWSSLFTITFCILICIMYRFTMWLECWAFLGRHSGIITAPKNWWNTPTCNTCIPWMVKNSSKTWSTLKYDNIQNYLQEQSSNTIASWYHHMKEGMGGDLGVFLEILLKQKITMGCNLFNICCRTNSLHNTN